MQGNGYLRWTLTFLVLESEQIWRLEMITCTFQVFFCISVVVLLEIFLLVVKTAHLMSFCNFFYQCCMYLLLFSLKIISIGFFVVIEARYRSMLASWTLKDFSIRLLINTLAIYFTRCFRQWSKGMKCWLKKLSFLDKRLKSWNNLPKDEVSLEFLASGMLTPMKMESKIHDRCENELQS